MPTSAGKNETHMVKVYSIATKENKIIYKKARKRRKKSANISGQLNLFDDLYPKIIKINTNLSPFEEALFLDEENDPAAQEAYLKAIFAGDCVADSYCNLGILESKNRNKVKAFDYFSNCLKIDERHVEGHYNLANLYLEFKEYRLAKLHYEIAVELNPDLAEVYYNLGIIYAILEYYEDAYLALFKFKELVPIDAGKKADALLKGLENSLVKN